MDEGNLESPTRTKSKTKCMGSSTCSNQEKEKPAHHSRNKKNYEHQQNQQKTETRQISASEPM